MSRAVDFLEKLGSSTSKLELRDGRKIEYETPREIIIGGYVAISVINFLEKEGIKVKDKLVFSNIVPTMVAMKKARIMFTVETGKSKVVLVYDTGYDEIYLVRKVK